MRDPDTGRKILVVSANAVVLEEILAGSVFKDEMNRYHQMNKKGEVSD